MTREHASSRPEYGVAPAGYRLPAASRPGRVLLQVADLERSLEYYGRVLGMVELPRPDGEAVLGAPGDDRPLVQLREHTGARPAPHGGRLGLYHYALLLPDRAALARFARHLTEIGARAGSADHAVSEAFYLQDPDGLHIEVYADRPRAEWRQRDRELLMTTDPLDLRDLLAAAGEASWSGMPAGTRVGHLHLHVGDLARAAAFYHDGLGLDRVVWSYPGALFLSAGGYHHHLGLNTWAAFAVPAAEADARLLEWELLLPSVRDAHAALENLAQAGHAIHADEHGGRVRDPWGTLLRLRASD